MIYFCYLSKVLLIYITATAEVSLQFVDDGLDLRDLRTLRVHPTVGMYHCRQGEQDLG